MFEELNLLIALAIVQMMPADIAAAMPDEDLSALMVSVFERKYDITVMAGLLILLTFPQCADT